MRVYIDQLECTGSGQCEMIAPELFVLLDDGIATVRDAGGAPMPDGAMKVGVAVPIDLEAKARDASDVCPGACIYCIDSTGTAAASVPHHADRPAPPELPIDDLGDSPPIH